MGRPFVRMGSPLVPMGRPLVWMGSPLVRMGRPLAGMRSLLIPTNGELHGVCIVSKNRSHV
jgi:hypothetical protein